jgi:hypothetical protein
VFSLEKLVNQRVLSRSGGDRPVYELMNDLLASVVEQSRMARVESLGKEKAEADRSQLRAYLCAVDDNGPLRQVLSAKPTFSVFSLDGRQIVPIPS